ncbi:hypothetical protein CR513_34052, partial [Mucuna pruriens]
MLNALEAIVEFEKEENINNVVFEKESINDIGKVFVTITIQETTPIIEDNVQTIVLPQTPIEQLQQLQEVSLRRSIRERRHTIPNDYIVFFQEHDDDIGLTADDSINLYQLMHSSNSQKWTNVMKDEINFMQDNHVWNLVELLEGVKPIGCKWIFKTKNNSKDNVERYKICLKEDIYYKETFSLVSPKDSFRIVMTLVAHFGLELY